MNNKYQQQILTILFLFFMLPLSAQTLIEKRDGKHIGFVNEQGKVVIPIIYDIVYDIYGEAIVVRKNGKTGLLSRDNKVLLPIACEDFFYGYGYIFLSKKGKQGLFDKSGKQILPFKYDGIYASDWNNEYFIVKENNKYGVIDREQNPIIAIKYGKLDFVDETFLSVEDNSTSLYGVIDLSEKEIIPRIYKSIEAAWNTGHFIVRNNKNEYGIVNENHQEVIPLKYGNFKLLDDGTYLVHESFYSSIKGVLDTLGQVLVPIEYKYIEKPFNGLRTVSRDNKHFGFINDKNETIIPFEYNHIPSLRTGTFMILSEVASDKCVILDLQGKRLTKYDYDSYDFSFHTKQIVLERDGKFGLVDMDLNTVFPFEYNYLRFGDDEKDILIVQKDGKWGYIDTQSNIIVPFIYEDIIELSRETQAFLHKEKWTIIDNVGKITTPDTFDEIISDELPQVHIVRKGSLYGIIDRWGSVMEDFEYEIIRRNGNGDYEVKLKNTGKWGVLSLPFLEAGRLVTAIPCEYDSVEMIEEGSHFKGVTTYKLRKGTKWTTKEVPL